MRAIIKQIVEKIKYFFKKIVDFFALDIVFYSLLIVFASSISFFLGSLSEFEKQKEQKLESIKLLHVENENKIYYVASKKGEKYYLPWCYSGSEKNKVRFKTKEDAEKKGYQPSKHCQGM